MNYIDDNVFNPLKTDLIVNCELITKLTCAFLLQENIIGSFSELCTLNLKNTINALHIIRIVLYRDILENSERQLYRNT